MKLLKKCTQMLLVFALVLSVTSTAFGAEWSDNDTDFTGTIMPLAQHSDAYHQLTVEELNSDTDTLIDLLLDNGYTFDLTLSNRSNTESYNHIRSYFNGFPELESRNDAGSLMLEKLVSGESDGRDCVDLMLLRILLSIPVYQNMLTAGEIQLLTETTDQCNSTRAASVIVVNEFTYDIADSVALTTDGGVVALYIARTDHTEEK